MVLIVVVFQESSGVSETTWGMRWTRVGKSGGVRECPFKCVECDELDIVEDEKKIYEGFEIACEDSPSKSREVSFGMLRSGAIEG